MYITIHDNQFRDLKNFKGEPAFPDIFTSRDLTADFELISGPNEFGWARVPGELYHVNAPLNSDIWNEDFRRRFAQWRCAVFAPDGFEQNPRPLPVVFSFAGIGGDYSDNAVYVRHVVKELGCIMVTFDLHLTGYRVLTDDKSFCDANTRIMKNIAIMKSAGRPIDNTCLKQFVTEQAFNITQICAMLKERYKIPGEEPLPVIAMGFSLGGFYAHQCALQLPNCVGAVCAAASADICRFGKDTVYDFPLLPRVKPFQWARKAPWLIPGLDVLMAGILHKYATYAMAIARVTQTPYSGKAACGRDIPIRFVIGSEDKMVSVQREREACMREQIPNRTVIEVKGMAHKPDTGEFVPGFNDVRKLNPLGERIVQELSGIVRDWRSAHGE